MLNYLFAIDKKIKMKRMHLKRCLNGPSCRATCSAMGRGRYESLWTRIVTTESLEGSTSVYFESRKKCHARFGRQMTTEVTAVRQDESGRDEYRGERDGSMLCEMKENGENVTLSKTYKRVMLKVSGEALEGSNEFGIDPAVLKTIAKEVAEAVRRGVQVAIVVGGGNFFRGVDRWEGLDRATGDYVGMLATVMNAICLQSALEEEGVATRVQTAIAMQEVAEPYIRRRAIRHLERGRVVIFGAGTGNPFFTTDTAAALRAAEIGADAFFKATKVDGVYDCDPVRNPNAKLHTQLSFRDVLLQSLNVMDETAITLCKENSIPVVVFNLTKPGNILAALLGSSIGTHIASSLTKEIIEADNENDPEPQTL